MFKRKKTTKGKTGKRKVLTKKTTAAPKGRNATVKKVALRLIAAPTKKNKDAMLKAIVRSL